MTLQEIKEKYCVDAKNGEVTGFVTLRMANDGGFPQSLNFQIPGTKTWDKKSLSPTSRPQFRALLNCLNLSLLSVRSDQIGLRGFATRMAAS